jgi:indolepyruvate ferredoxin oxidoreductase alpha subunit
MRLPVLMRVVTRLAHSRAGVMTSTPIPQNKLNPDSERTHWVLLPGNARRQYASLVEKQAQLLASSEASPYNKLHDVEKAKIGVVACGIAYNYVMENCPAKLGIPVLKVSQYPLPTKLVKKMAEECESILIVEEGQPFIEEKLRGLLDNGIKIYGKLTGELPRTGELTPDSVRQAVGLAPIEHEVASQVVMPRPPALCQGCPHIDSYTALNEVMAEYKDGKVFGDIGCYTLGVNMGAINTTVCMGASITMAKGASEVGVFPAVAVIGDGTFGHSGLTGLLDCINEKANVVVMILDNEITGMTGGQPSSANNKLENICIGLGVDPNHIRTIVPLKKNHEEFVKILKEEIAYNGVSVIIPRRICLVEAKKHLTK